MPNIPSYWGGSGSNLGEVHPLDCLSFASFVTEQLGHPVILPTLTRAQFLALPKADRNTHKRVSFFTPAAFRSAHRVAADAAHCNLLCLDIDDPAQAAPFANYKQALIDRLTPYAFAAYLTASSTPQAPRLRVVVSAREIPLDRYADAVRWVGGLLGLSSVTSESQVAVQPMYRPTIFRDDDPVSDHPLIVAVPEGGVVGLSSLGTVAADRSGETPSGNPLPQPRAEDLEFLRPEAENVTFDDVRTALYVLDPDCSYNEWIEVAAALHHQFPRSEQAEEAFSLFDDWSQRGAKYTGLEDTRSKWGSFKPTPRGRAPVTIRTVFHRATLAGWSQGEALAERCYAELDRAIAVAQINERELKAFLARIVQAPLLSRMQTDMLVTSLAKRAKQPRTVIRKALLSLERTLRVAQGGGKEELPRWARGFCFVSNQNKFFQHHSGEKFSPEAFDRYYGERLMADSTERGVPTVKPQDFMLNIAHCPRVQDYIYSPLHGGDAFVTLGQTRLVNLYIPTYPDPDPASAAQAGEVIEDHLGHLISETAYQGLLLDFFAYHVQHPGKKIRWAVLLQGAQGCGKTVLAEMMRAILGKEHVRSIGAEALFGGNFNGWSSGAQLCAIEEVRVAGHNRHEVMNSLKPCISNDFITVNEKFQVPYQTPNITNYLMFTNWHDSLAVSDGDRRYFVLESSLQDARQVRELGEAYFDRLWNTVRTKGAGLRAWFESRAIAPAFQPDGHAPATPYLRDLASAAASPLASAVDEILAEGVNPLVRRDLAAVSILRQIVELQKGLDRPSNQTIAAVLRERGMVKVGRHLIEEQQECFWASRSLRPAAGSWLSEIKTRLAEKDAILQ